MEKFRIFRITDLLADNGFATELSVNIITDDLEKTRKEIEKERMELDPNIDSVIFGVCPVDADIREYQRMAK
jgi:hypothetical protein